MPMLSLLVRIFQAILCIGAIALGVYIGETLDPTPRPRVTASPVLTPSPAMSSSPSPLTPVSPSPAGASSR